LADNTFRTLRSRQVPASERPGAAPRDASDPLAELARLIGQSDPYAERQSEARERRPVADDVASSEREWAEGDEVEQAYATEARYTQPPPAMPRATPLRQYAPQSAEPDYEHEPPADDQYFSAPSEKDGGYHDGADTEDPRRERPSAAVRPIPAFLTGAPHEETAEFAEPEHDTGDEYASEDYYQPSQPRRRGGLVMVMAVLGLAVVGTAGAFAYRTTFGGSLLPALPPVIKANTSPNKVTPNSGDAQAANPGQGGTTTASAAENVVSREEEPINIEPPKPAPRIISTIPVNNNQNAALPPSVIASAAPMPGSAVPAGAPASVPSGSPAWASSPAIAAPVATAPAQASPPVNAAAAPQGPPPEPKKIHTVTIRPDQAGGADARSSAHAAAPARASAPDGNAPLALVPGGGAAASSAPPRSHRSPPSAAVASAATAGTAPSETSSAAGYAVQVSSQHSETEAQSSFQALRGKYPELLGKREPIIRRADLGAKGIYYRALVGPFASADEAAAMCSSLKAAGGNCIVQKN
jgi:hypothetical protein